MQRHSLYRAQLERLELIAGRSEYNAEPQFPSERVSGKVMPHEDAWRNRLPHKLVFGLIRHMRRLQA